MNRRGFLTLFGAGLPAAVIAEKVGLIEKARKYFFAPKGGWNSDPYDIYRRSAELYAERPDSGILLNVKSFPFYEGHEIALYDASGEIRRGERLVIQHVNLRDGVITLNTVPFGVEPGDLLVA